MSDSLRGLEANQEIDREELAVDIRPWKEKFREKLEKPQTFATYAILGTGTVLFLPFLNDVLFIFLLFFFKYANNLNFKLPFRTPISSGRLDLNFLPKKTKPDPKSHKAKGISYFGIERKTNKELWFESDDLRTHILIFGSTGAGKALKLTEKVLTPKGWVINKDLQKGDTISTINGNTTIVDIFPQGELNLYKLTFEDGRTIEVSGDHLWEVTSKEFILPENKNGTAVLKTIQLQDHIQSYGSNSLFIPAAGLIKNHNYFTKTDAVAYLNNQLGVNFNKLQDYVDYLLNVNKEQDVAIDEKIINDLYYLDKKNFIIKLLDQISSHEMGNLIINHENENFIKSLQNLLFSVGCVVNLVNKINFSNNTFKLIVTSNNFADITNKNLDKLVSSKNLGLKIVSIEETETKEECQCLKVSDSRGLFITKDYLVTHNTESLLSLAFNSFVQGSGLIYVDGKGDVSLFTKVFSMARKVGREDDILVINYMTGSRDVIGPQENKLSNTLNPFAQGSSGGLTELLVSLMDDGGGDGMWKGRAISLIACIMTALCFMRDNEGLLLDIDVIREHLILETIIKLNKRRDLPPNIRQSIRGYLVSLPGFQEGAPKQNETALEQHGYLQMQFTRILGSLSDTYGYIFKTNLGEVDFKDVVLNRRILIVLLPALEKSSDELANLGKIIVACLKQMMAEGLGNKLEGTHDDVIETRPTKSPTPFVTILDEYGYYSVKGAAVMPAQARSLGFSMIFAGQDYAAFKKGDEKEAESIVANCNIKIFMKLEDPMATYELFEKSVGEGMVTQTSRYTKGKPGLFGGPKYVKEDGVSTETRKRGNLLDLKEQGPGEAHVLFKSSLIRATMFFANPKNAISYRVNYFVKVEPPEAKDISKLDNSIKELYIKVTDKKHLDDIHDIVNDEDDLVKQIKIAYTNHQHLVPKEAACATIALIGEEMQSLLDDDVDSISSNRESTLQNKVSIFGNDEEFDDEPETFFKHREKTRKALEEVEKLSGNKNYAKSANSTIDDLRDATKYPTGGVPEDKEPGEFIDLIKELDNSFVLNVDDDDD